jgi:hypothetical protein
MASEQITVLHVRTEKDERASMREGKERASKLHEGKVKATERVRDLLQEKKKISVQPKKKKGERASEEKE